MPNFSALIAVFLCAGCAHISSHDDGTDPHKVLVGDYEIHVPSRFVQDLRYFGKGGMMIFRETVGGEFTGATVGISLEDFDDEALAALERIGYRQRKYCATLILSSGPTPLGEQTVVAIPPAFVVFGNLSEADQEMVLNSFCGRIEASDAGYEKIEG